MSILPIKISKKAFLTGWILYTLWAAFFACILSIGAHLPYLIALISGIISYYPLAFYSIFLLAFYRRFSLDKHKIHWFILTHFIVMLFFSAIWLSTDYFLNWILWKEAVFQFRPLDSVGTFQFYTGILLYALLTGIYYTTSFYKRYKEKELKASQLQTLTQEAELKALKSQINPHFLFNTLNTIFALIDYNTLKAKDTVTKLSSLLRYSLAGFHNDFVTIKEELECIEIYLSIEKVRFGERLDVKYDIDKKLLNNKVPPMILQPVVENAVKHGISTTKKGGLITIAVQRSGNKIMIQIEDNGKGKSNPLIQESYNNGIGLLNLKQRLERIYGKNFTFEAGPVEPHGFRVILQIQ
jgi:sensor histidine kinase YesM